MCLFWSLQKDIDFLKVNIHEARQTVRERKAQLESEERTQTQLRREIEVREWIALDSSQIHYKMTEAEMRQCCNPLTSWRFSTQIQQRRCEAVLKRLRSQLKKAQSGHWQLRSDVTHLEKQLQDLRSQLEEDQRWEKQVTLMFETQVKCVRMWFMNVLDYALVQWSFKSK